MSRGRGAASVARSCYAFRCRAISSASRIGSDPSPTSRPKRRRADERVERRARNRVRRKPTPSDVLAAVKHLLTHRPPRVKSPEEEAFEEELAAWSDAEIEEELRELEAADNERRATSGPDADVAADTEDEPGPSEAPGSEVITRCLEALKRIGDGFDSRASGRDRMRAAELRGQYLAATSPRDATRGGDRFVDAGAAQGRARAASRRRR